MRTDIELLEMLRDRAVSYMESDARGYGLCAVASQMHGNGILSWVEYKNLGVIIRDELFHYRSIREASQNGFYWPSKQMQPRIDAINRLITDKKNKL